MKELVRVEDLTVSRWGRRPEERPLEDLLRWGVLNVDKPQGPTSHQVTAWVRDLLGVEKTGHGGTLDPRVTGVLPIAMGEAVRALDALHAGDKEYVGVLRLHQDVPEKKLRAVAGEFVGEIYQTPPVRAAVKRERRARRIHALDLLEVEGRDVLFRVRCEAGTYIRTLCVDVGDALGVGGHMQDLRRTRSASFVEEDAHSLADVRDAFVFWREDANPDPLRRLFHPMERLLDHLPKFVVKDSAVDALCHGADLAVPGVLQVTAGVRPDDLVAVLTRKGEGVALARAMMPAETIVKAANGVAADVFRVLMEPGTYPRLWRAEAARAAA